MGYTNTDKIVAFVPKGKKKYSCVICARQEKMAEMKLHLEAVHGLKVSGGGYAFYREEV